MTILRSSTRGKTVVGVRQVVSAIQLREPARTPAHTFLGTVWRFILFAALTGVAAPLVSQSSNETPAEPPTSLVRPQILVMRADEDWSALRDPAMRLDWLDRLKYIPLSGGGHSYLSLGGEFRGAPERVQNDNWSPLPYGLNSFGLQRYLLHADIHFDPRVRLFVQLESGIEQGRPGGPRLIDEKQLDLLNAFLQFRPFTHPHTPSIRVGKQELQFGAGRLVSAREGPNVRQGFFGVRVDEEIGGWQTSGFATRPSLDRFGYFNDGPDGHTGFWGLETHRVWQHFQQVEAEAYYFGLDRKLAVFNQGAAHEVRQSVGGRFATTPPLQLNDRRLVPRVDVESIFQFGSFGSAPVRAWGLATETALLFPQVSLAPEIVLRVDTASGDHRQADGVLRTYNPLFPIGDYFSVLADTGPGPVNFRDIHPKLILHVDPRLTVTFDELLWWRASLGDGVYGVPGNLLVASRGSLARFVGHRPGIEARWQIDRHAYIQGDYGVFFAGPFLRQSGASRNLNYASVWVGYKF